MDSHYTKAYGCYSNSDGGVITGVSRLVIDIYAYRWKEEMNTLTTTMVNLSEIVQIGSIIKNVEMQKKHCGFSLCQSLWVLQ